jgi:hypothetical protein
LIALRHLTADASARKSYSEAISYSKQIVSEPKAMVGDRIDYLQLLRVANDTNFSPWLASMKQEAVKSPIEAFALGRWMAIAENPTNALQWLQSLPPSIQTNQPVPLIVADCCVALKDWAGLMALLEKQDWADANYFRLALEARAEGSLGQDIASQTTWRKAVRLANHRLDRLARLAEATSGWGWETENTEVLKEITSSFPKEKWAAEQLVTKLYAAGDSRALGDLLAKLYAADPSDVKSKNNLASISLLRKADLDRAYRLAQEAYNSAPENPFCISTYAYSLLLQNKQDMALKVVSNLKPQYLQIPSVAAYCGVVEAQSGNKDLAKAHLERAASAKLLPEEKEMVRLAKAGL